MLKAIEDVRKKIVDDLRLTREDLRKELGQVRMGVDELKDQIKGVKGQFDDLTKHMNERFDRFEENRWKKVIELAEQMEADMRHTSRGARH